MFKKIILIYCILFCAAKITVAQTGDPLISLELPEKSFVGSKVELSGSSIKYESFNKVKISITGPKSYKLDTLLPMENNGKFMGRWQAPFVDGDYKMIVQSSDKKKTATKTIKIEPIFSIANMATDNITSAKKVITIMEEKVGSCKKLITAKDGDALDKKFNDFKAEMNKMVVLYQHINEANEVVANKVKNGGTLPQNLSDNLGQLNNTLNEVKQQETRAAEIANHKATDVTICEILNIIKECTLLYSTITNFAAKSIKGVVVNVAIDKGVPYATGKAMDFGASIADKNASLSDAKKFVPGELNKIYALAKTDLDGLKSMGGKMGVAGDLIGFIADVLLEIYCGTFEGSVKQTYNFRHFNGSGEDWWIYDGILEGRITLRYPKASNTGNIIKMKGTIEGNATSFKFGADPKKAIKDEVSLDVYNHTKLIPIQDLKPPTVPFNVTEADKEYTGFGAVARTGIPASFLMSVDAEYNQETKEVKLFINNPINDFTPLIKCRQVYAFVKYQLAVELNYQDYPIAPAFKTFKKNLEDKNTFQVLKNEKNKLSFFGTINKIVEVKGSKIKLSLFIDAEKK